MSISLEDFENQAAGRTLIPLDQLLAVAQAARAKQIAERAARDAAEEAERAAQETAHLAAAFAAFGVALPEPPTAPELTVGGLTFAGQISYGNPQLQVVWHCVECGDLLHVRRVDSLVDIASEAAQPAQERCYNCKHRQAEQTETEPPPVSAVERRLLTALRAYVDDTVGPF